MIRKKRFSLLFVILLSLGLAFPWFDGTRPMMAQALEASNNYQVFLPVTMSTYQEVYCYTPYTADSIWNTPIDWSHVRIHPQNAGMISAFFGDDQWIGSNTDMYTPNIYLVTNETPLIPVKLFENRFRDAISDVYIEYGEPGGTVWMPIPEDAQPALGTDGQLAVINLDTGEEWGLNSGEVDGYGNWYAGGAYRYHIDNSGIPPEGFGQRGGGISQLAGIVRACEIERGYIGHAVTIGYDYPCHPDACEESGWPAIVPPFKTTDGHGSMPFDIPEGARLVIRPDIPKEAIVAACGGIKGCELWVENMQIYGGFIVDNSSHPKTYAEGSATAHWSPDVWTNTMLQNIPQDWYAIVDWE